MAIYSIPVKDEQTGEMIYVRIEAKNNQEAKQIARNTEGYCGADIEEIVEHEVETKNVEDKNKDIKIKDLERAIKKINSLKSVLNEQIENLNEVYKKNKMLLKKFTIKDPEKSTLDTLIDMVVVNGGKYKPNYRGYEVKVIDLEVSKYQVTNKLWNGIMKNTSGDMLPVVNITYWEALEFCNKLSKKYGLKPVYKINNKSIKIIDLDGKEVAPGKADFSKTEGFRLPTEVEWEWFARGGEVAIQNNTFDYKYSGSNDLKKVAVCNTNQIKSVGTKKSNQLGLYDCSGNVWEWCYDTFRLEINRGNNEFIYSKSVNDHVIKGGSFLNDAICCMPDSRNLMSANLPFYILGFRVVRTL